MNKSSRESVAKRRKVMKQAIEWVMAIAVAVVILNALSFFYYHPANEIKREEGATPGFMVPGAWTLYGYEGYGIQEIDSRGYVNKDLPITEDYILVMGSSHTEGFHVPQGARYTDILNNMLLEEEGGSNELKVYNIAHSGYKLPDILKHFSNALQDFPNPKMIIIETAETSFTEEELIDAKNQLSYNPEEQPERMLQSLSGQQRAINQFKNMAPFLRVLTMQYQTIRGRHPFSVPVEAPKADLYKSALSDAFGVIREEYSGDIIILYHPYVEITNNGLLVLEDETSNLFGEICREYGITFVNVSQDYVRAYEDERVVPTGFHNTSLGYGHINKYGNRIIAEAIYKQIKELYSE